MFSRALVDHTRVNNTIITGPFALFMRGISSEDTRCRAPSLKTACTAGWKMQDQRPEDAINQAIVNPYVMEPWKSARGMTSVHD